MQPEIILSSLILFSILVATRPGSAAPSQTGSTPGAQSLVFAQNGKTPYVISLASDAIPAEQTAARELSEHLQKISGATFVVKPENEVKADAPQILVGAGQRVKKLLPSQKWDALGTDGIVIKTVGRNLILAGGRPRGTLYAVYSFLEDLGVRWWTPTESTIPSRSTLRVAPQNISYTPQLKVREPYYSHLYSSEPEDGIYCARLKVNGTHQHAVGEALGGRNAFAGHFVHNMGYFLLPEKYFKAHPEWYSNPSNDGKPSTAATPMPDPQGVQLCMTNEEARREMTKVALEQIRQFPDSSVIDISPNDNINKCTCENCTALEEKEGSPAGPLLHFVNAVAADIEREFPRIQVETMAYEHTRKAPRFVRPRHNVVIRLASDHADFSKGMAKDKSFHALIDDWKKIAPRLYIWNYVGNHHNPMFPHPNLRTLGPDIRYVAANNAIALFNEGDRYTNFAGDFVAMRVWVQSHLMWNPALEQKQLEDEFLRGYYGAAAPHLRAYLETIQDAFPKSGMQLSMTQSMHWWLTLDAMNAATKHFRKAQVAVAKDATLSRRVRRERLAFDHAWLMRYYPLRREADRRNAAFEGPKDINAFAVEFLRVGQEMDATRATVDILFKDYEPVLKKRLANHAAPLPDVTKGKAEGDIIDLQEDRFRLYRAGELVTLVDDAKASNKRAASMIGSSADWLVQADLKLQWPLEQTEWYLKDDLWRCYVVARVQPKAGAIAGPVLLGGLYDTKSKVESGKFTKTLDEIGDGQYHVIDLGAHKLNPYMYFYVTPPGRDDIESVSIDRILLVRETKTAQ